MKTYGAYFQNDADKPLCWGEVGLINPPHKRLRGNEKNCPRGSSFFVFMHV